MKINHSNPSLPAAAVDPSNRLSPAPEGKPGAAPVSPASPVSLSGAGRMQSLMSQLEAVPEVDLEKVASIKLALANGQYTSDPARIAAGLLDAGEPLIRSDLS